MPKKLIIGISIGIAVLGVAVFSILLIRARALREPEPAAEVPVAVPPPAAGGLRAVEMPDRTPQAGPCGDGVCSEGESWCKPDCGNAEERFLGSIKAAPTPTSLKISWKTDGPSTGEVRYGRTDRYELGSLPSAAPATEHEVLISGLSPGGSYYVHLRSMGEDGSAREAGPLFFELPGSTR